jgi:RimJ/RimL family protein N-acetyltransferase
VPAPRPLRPVSVATRLALRDGTCVSLRPLVPEDRALVEAAFERMSDRSRFLRFFSPVPRLTRRTLDQLMAVDQVRHVALAAIQDGECIGVVRYVVDRRDPTLADFAITVIDAHQGRGLGRALTAAIARVAYARGVRRLTLDVHPENRVMQRLARSLGAHLTLRDGVLSGTLRLPLAEPVEPALPAAA